MAARQPGDNSQPHVVITIEQPSEQIIPAIQLEQQEIRRMTIQQPSTVPHIITASTNGKKEQKDAERIVGKTEGKSLGAERLETKEATEETKMEQIQPVEETPGSRLTVEHAEKRQRRQSTEIMEYIEEQEKHFEEQAQQAQQAQQAHTLTRKPRSRRSPSPASQRQSVGLDHLENLVKLMEQLTNLRDENNKLKKRCAFLESTKNLLQAKNTLAPEQYHHGYMSLPARTKLLKKAHTNPEQSSSSKESLRKRIPSESDITCFDIIESCSDQTPKRPKSGLPKYPKRSLSVGSLEQPVDLLEQDMNRLKAEMLAAQVRNESASMTSKSEKQKTKSSKWKKVKKVLTGGQKLYEDINWGIRSLKEFSRGHSRYSSVSSHRQLGSTHRHHPTENKSEDSGVGSGFEAEIRDAFRLAALSAEQQSSGNGKKNSNHAAVADTDPVSGIWMGPPEWIEKYEAARKVSTGSGHSDTSVHSSDKPQLEVQILRRRQSSPSLVEPDDEITESSGDTVGTIRRSTSWKEVEIPPGLKDYDSVSKSEKKAYKIAWNKVKDIIHTRKESVRQKSTKKKMFLDQEFSETDMEGITLEDLQSADTTQTDYSLSTHSEHSSPITLRKSKCVSEIPLTAGAIDMAALLGGLSDEFSRKLHQWEEKKRLSVPARESTASDRQSMESSGSLSQEFQQKLDEWEKIRGKSLGSPTSLREKKDGSDVTPPERASTPVDLNRSATVEELQQQLSDSFNRKMQDWEKKKYRREFERSPSLDRKGSTEKRERSKSKRVKSDKDKETVRQEKLRERELQKVEKEQHKLEKEKLRLEKVCLKALEREARIEKMKGRLSLSECEAKNPILGPLAEIKVTTDFAKKLREWEGKKGKDVPTALYLEAKQRGFELLKVEQQSIDPGGKVEGLLSDSSIILSDSDESRKPQPLTLLPSSSESPDDASPIERTSDSSLAASGTSGRSEVFDFEPAPPASKFDFDDLETSSGVRTKQKPPPLSLQPTIETTPLDTPEPSPLEKCSETSIIDDTTSISNDIPTTSNIASLERANTQLIEELHNKEIEYNTLHGGVGELNERLCHIKNLQFVHHEKYRGEIPQATEPDKFDTEMNEMVTNMKDLEDQIRELETFGEKLAVSMESAAMFKWQSIEGETSVNVRLMDLINKMRLMLFHASGSEEAPQMTSALQSFEKLYCQAMQLQLQMNNLRLSHLDRNMEIMFMKRQLVLQEVNNLILQVDITKRQSELVHYSQSKQQTDPRFLQTLAEQNADAPIITDEDEEDEDTPVNERHPLHKMLTALETTKPQSIIRQRAVEYDEGDALTLPVTRKMDVSTSSETTIEPQSLDTSVQTLDSSFSGIPMSISSCDNSMTASECSAVESVQSAHTTSINIPDKPHKIFEKELQSLKEECLSSDRDSRAFSDSSKSSDIEYLCTLTLPAASVSIPKDISKPERKISRCSRSPTPIDMTSHSEESESDKSEEEYHDISYGKEMDLDFPELIIPDWQKTKLYKPKETKSMDDQIFRQGAAKIKMVDIKIEPQKRYKKRREIEAERQTPVFYSPVIASRYQRRKPSDRINHDAPDSRPASTYEYFDLQDPMSLRRRMHSTSSGSSTDTDKIRPKFDFTSLVRPRIYPDERPLKKIPLRDAVSKFEQQVPYRARILQNLELSKSSSPTLHLSRVGILTPVRPLKPAAELWEESQRYRSGHSIYASRILKRQLQCSKSSAQYPDKENVSDSYVKQIIDRLSKDVTPERNQSSSDLQQIPEGSSHSIEMKRKHSTEFVQHIVHKLSDPSDKVKQTAPFKDLTNSGQVKKLAEVFNSNEHLVPERTVSDSLPSHTVTIEKTDTSDEVFLPPGEAKPRPSSHPETTTSSSMKPDSTISAQPSYSMPTLGEKKRLPAKEKKSKRVLKKSSGSEIEILQEEYLPTKEKPRDRSLSPSWWSMFPGVSPKKPSKSEQKGGKGKMGTIGVLCQQSMTFDLGVSLKPEIEEESPPERLVEGAEASPPEMSGRPCSTSSEGDGQPQSPTEKKKSKKFPSAGWLQKPMKLFKVSKCCERDRV